MADRLPYGSGRTSPQRRAIASMAEELGRAFTIDDLERALRRKGKRAGVATVYRAVAAMEESGWLERVGVRGSKALYARCDSPAHHHHLVCTSCGIVLATDCPLEFATHSAKAEHGFTVTEHDVTLYGVCRDCRPGPELGEDGD
ncbi:MAG: transcriptional repressor [Coriobacteriia bacterium]|nr:transcriptional repressor [Coriobacteriia bacterium]